MCAIWSKTTRGIALSLLAGISITIVSKTSIANDLRTFDNSDIIESDSIRAYPRYRAGADRSADRVTIDPCESFRWANRPYENPRSVIGPQGRFSAGWRSRLPADIPSTYSRGPESLVGELVVGQKTIAGREIQISEYFELGDGYDYGSCLDTPGVSSDPLK